MNSPAHEMLIEARFAELDREIARTQDEAAALRLCAETLTAKNSSVPRRWAAACLIRAGEALAAVGRLLAGPQPAVSGDRPSRERTLLDSYDG